MRYKSNAPDSCRGRARRAPVSGAQIWIQPLDGTGPRSRSTSTPYSHRSAAVSPDGQWIAFVADRAAAPGFGGPGRARFARAGCPTMPSATRRRATTRTSIVMPAAAARRAGSRRPAGARASSPGRRTAGASPSPRARRAPRRRGFTSWTPRRRHAGKPAGRLAVRAGAAHGGCPTADRHVTASIGGRTACFRVDPATKKPIEEIVSGRRRIVGFRPTTRGQDGGVRRHQHDPADRAVRRECGRHRASASSPGSTTSSMPRSPGPTPSGSRTSQSATWRSKAG